MNFLYFKNLCVGISYINFIILYFILQEFLSKLMRFGKYLLQKRRKFYDKSTCSLYNIHHGRYSKSLYLQMAGQTQLATALKKQNPRSAIRGFCVMCNLHMHAYL